MRNFMFVATWLFVALVVRPSSASEIAYSFQGTVFSAPGSPSGDTPFGRSISAGSAFTGHFAYNTSSIGVVVSANSKTFRQHRTDGFEATFGSSEFRADDYFVTVSNDLTSGTIDQVVIQFSKANFSGPPYPSLLVNDVPNVGQGLLVVSLKFGGAEFANTSLPASLHDSNLKKGTLAALSLLGDDSWSGSGGGVDVLFRVGGIAPTTLAPEVPEPAAGSLAIWTMGALSLFLAVRRDGKQ